MLDYTKIIVSAKNIIDGQVDNISNFVTFKVRFTELEAINRKMKANKEALEKEYTSVIDFNAYAATEEQCKKSGVIFEDWTNNVKERNTILEEIEKTGCTSDMFNALDTIDRTFITLQARACGVNVSLPNSITKEQGIETLVSTYRENGSLTDIKGRLKLIFKKTVGENGLMFYGVKLTKSDFSDEIVRDFCARFTGKASRTTVKTKNVTKNNPYAYSHRENSEKYQAEMLTELFAIILDSSKDYTVLNETEKTVKETAPAIPDKKATRKTTRKQSSKETEKTEAK